MKAVNCRNGDLLAQEQVTATGKEQVLKSLGEASSKIREKLGESPTSVQEYDAPPENVTTPSLEALKAYSLRYQAQIVKGDFPAINRKPASPIRTFSPCGRTPIPTFPF